jgi:peptidoglycan/LPS O-acetylase OafA/YrhL
METAEPKPVPGKLLPLEGLRGIAAAIVVLYHLVLGFTRKGVGVVPHGHGVWDVVVQFAFGLLNGGAAVAVFFVLSGFILSLPFANDRRLSRVLVAMLKRWPRLAALTTIACLLGWALIWLSAHEYKDAAGVIGSGWLATHGNAPLAGQRLTLPGALREGLFNAFLYGDVHFDSPLWTMRIELFCSFAIFLTAPVLFAIQSWPLRLVLIFLVMMLCGGTYPVTYFSDFLAGTVVAMLYAEDRLPVFANWQAAVVGLVAIYLFSFTYEQKLLIHAPIKAVMPAGDTSHFVWDGGAVLMILLLLGNPFLRLVFSKTWAVWLGMLSFPIYLLHGPIMLSAGAAAFNGAQGALGRTGGVLAAMAASLALTLACAVPLVWVDKAWTRVLNRATKLLLRPPAPAAARRAAALRICQEAGNRAFTLSRMAGRLAWKALSL